jgi:acetyl-CoA carboxylase biotin carboxyl carrier protein
MKITSREIIEILKTVRELGFREFRLEHDGLQISASSSTRAGEPTATFTSISPQPAPPLSSPGPQPDLPAPRPPGSPAAVSAERPPSREGCVAVAAPMSGTFYRLPSPGAPPFVNVGSTVKANDIVCIIEVMKLFNSIRAAIDGVVEEILVDNEASVVAGQTVIWLKPVKG